MLAFLGRVRSQMEEKRQRDALARREAPLPGTGALLPSERRTEAEMEAKKKRDYAAALKMQVKLLK